MATLIKIDGTQKTVTPRNKEKGFALEEVYELLDCSMVQCVRVGEGRQARNMLMDEEGKLHEGWVEKINQTATFMFRATYPMSSDVVVGDVLICNKKEWQ